MRAIRESSTPCFWSNLLLFIVAVAAFGALAGSWVKFITPSVTFAQDTESPEGNRKILVEIFLAPDRRDDLASIKKAFEDVSVTRVRVQFFRLGHPPLNIAIGDNVPASIARLAIGIAKTYNGGVKFLLPQYRFFPEHIAIGTSAFDEASHIPIRAEDLDRLSDPALTTSQFHALYRQLTGEDKRLPTYLK
jgi:hypothetical protein